MDFPVFDGDNPKLWINRNEMYFELFPVDPSKWVKVASMNFFSATARWLQSVEGKVKMVSWSELCTMILERFGKDQHALLIRQLFHIRQTGTVSEYVDQFFAIVDSLAAYETGANSLYFTTCFVDGLRDDIKSAIIVQRPSDLDTACVLAKLLEEVADQIKVKDIKRPEFLSSSRSFHHGAVPLPLPPRADCPGPSASAQDRRGMDAARYKPVDEKLAALRAYRRAKGLCEKCAERWSRDHKCAESVQLHALQEVWELLQLEDSGSLADQEGQVEGTPSGELFALSLAAVHGGKSPKTLKLSGVIQGKEVTMLVDSGSSHTFVSEQFSQSLSGSSMLQHPVQVAVADGTFIQCVSQFSDLQWSSQGCNFTSAARVLPLAHYDVILGMDWLESFSPMQIHWKQKWLLIPYEGSYSLLQGNALDVPMGSVVQVCALLVTDSKAVELDVPPELRLLLEEFAMVFEAPSGLLPSRSCDHTIPLIEGATPVNVRPYRYPPTVKDEIERQVTEMLKAGIIQHSISPFSSSVLLVKKKDATWRFCMDFRHLNAITVKCKYPVPVIDEFLDELAHASWFTSLDLTASYHQVKLKPGEEYKTAFQTHSGHYEFRVMAFGLSGGPATFQKAMNTTLQPLLRKCVLVFFDDILIYSRTYEEHLVHIRLVLELLVKD